MQEDDLATKTFRVRPHYKRLFYNVLVVVRERVNHKYVLKTVSTVNSGLVKLTLFNNALVIVQKQETL